MKKVICIPFLLAMLACSDGDGVESGDGSNHSMADSASTPSAIDTMQHPNGVTSGSVISRDTAAMRSDTSVSK